MVKLVNPSVEIITEIDSKKILQNIEKAARTCYKTESSMTEDGESAKRMINKLIDMGHTAMLEFSDIHVLLRCDVGCYDDKTLVLTENGWKLFKDLKTTDRVYTKTDDGEVILTNFMSIISKEWDGILHNYHSTQVNLCVTPDHNMWVYDNNKRSSKTKLWKFLESQDMKNKSYRFDKTGCKKRDDINRDIVINDVVKKCGFYNRTYKGLSLNNLAFFELLGWWITDGSIEKHKSNGHTVSLFQNKEKGRKRIEELLKFLNLDYSIYKNRYRIKSVALSTFIYNTFYNDNMKIKSYDITIPDFIRYAHTNEIEAFLKGVIGGDGTEYNDGRKIIYTASKSFAHDLIELYFKCGITANYYINDVSKYKCSYKNSKPIYVVSVSRTEVTWFDKNDKNYSEEYYKGNVYCVELEKYHRLFVMRNGKTCWCGNCYKDLTRHRQCSFAIESTRYCNYSKGKFGNEISVIVPINIEPDTVPFSAWYCGMCEMEHRYMQMAESGCTPDQMRMLLPHSTAAYVNIKANMREWRHIFGLRCAKAAHPSVRQAMLLTLDLFHDKIPVLFDDLYDMYKDDIEEFKKLTKEYGERLHVDEV